MSLYFDFGNNIFGKIASDGHNLFQRVFIVIKHASVKCYLILGGLCA